MDVVSIVNMKGGAGKTTTAANLAAVLGKEQKRVLLVDLDSQASLTCSLGIQEEHNVFTGVRWVETKMPNVFLVPGGPDLVRHEMDLAAQESFQVLRRLLSGVQGFDFLVLDCPPNLYGSTVNAIVASDQLLMPVPPSLKSIRSVGTTMRLLRNLGTKGNPVPSRICAFLTIYRKLAIETQLIQLLENVVPQVLNTRIRQSAHYSKEELYCTAAALFSTAKSSPVVDHQSLVRELGLL